MRIKKPPQAGSLPISSFIIHKDDYEIDRTYQREAGAWSKEDEQYLIDTILRGFGMPAIFLHRKNDTDFIVDGQQRINTIWRFKENKLPLNQSISNDIINDKKNIEYNEKPAYYYNDLSMDWKQVFDSYPLPIINLIDYNDEDIRDLFRRLQRGKPLVPGEILNAYPGTIVLAMRKLAEHKFFKEITSVSAHRYKHAHMAAQFLFLESEGIKSITPQYIYKFFENNKDINTNSNEYNQVKTTLNYISSVFKEKTPEIVRAWNITLYLMVNHLLKNYVMQNQKENLKEFYIKFYSNIMNAYKSGDEDLINFSNAIGKATNEGNIIKLRHKIILKNFLEKYTPMEKDEKRIFDDEQKRKIYRREEEKCNSCGIKLKFGDFNTHYHHKKMHSRGGETNIENGLLLCKNCHLTKFHHEKDID